MKYYIAEDGTYVLDPATVDYSLLPEFIDKYNCLLRVDDMPFIEQELEEQGVFIYDY